MGNKTNTDIASRIIRLIGGDDALAALRARRIETVDRGISFIIDGGVSTITVVVIRDEPSGFVVRVAAAGKTIGSREVSHVPAEKLNTALIHLLSIKESV